MDLSVNAQVILTNPERARREIDPLYFMENYLWIYDKNGHKRLLVLNEIQRAIYEEILDSWHNQRPVRLLVLKARRFGVSTLMLGLLLHATIYAPGSASIIEAHRLDSANYLFSILQTMYNSLSIVDAPEKPKAAQNAAGVLSFSHPHGASITVATGRSKSSGRAFQLKCFHGSEVAFWESPSEVMLGINSALSDTDANSIAVLESTANGVGGYYYDRYQKAKEGQAGYYKALFYPWWKFGEYKLPVDKVFLDGRIFGESDLSKRELEIRDRFNLSIEQMAFYRWVLDNKCEGREDMRAQEYPSDDEEAFLATGNCRFKSSTLAKITPVDSYLEGVMNARRSGDGMILSGEFVTQSNGYLRVWERPQKGVPYVIGGDVGEGQGQDFSAGVVINSQTGVQAAELYVQAEPDDELASLFYLLGMWYNWAYLGVEINGPGISTVKRLISLQYPLSRMFDQHDFIKASQNRTQTKRIGWRTTVTTRALMINRLSSALDEGDFVTRSERLLKQLKTFVRQSDGSYAAQQSGKSEDSEKYHDDLVMAGGIAVVLLGEPKARQIYKLALGRSGENEDQDFGGFGRNRQRKINWSSYRQ